MSGRRLTRLTLSIICWVIMSYAGDADATVLKDSDRVHSLSQKKVAPSSKKVNHRPAATSDPTESRRVAARHGKVAKYRSTARQTQDPEQVTWVDGTDEGARGSDQPKKDAPQAKNVQPSTAAAKGKEEHDNTYWVDEGDLEMGEDGLQDQEASLSTDVKAAVKDPTTLEHDDGDEEVVWAEDGDRGGQAAANGQQSSRGQAGGGAQEGESQGQQVPNPGPSTDHDTKGQGGAPLKPVTSSAGTSDPVQDRMEPKGSTAGEGGGHAAEGDDAVVWMDGDSAGGIEGGSKREGDAEKAVDEGSSERREPDQNHLESKTGWDTGSQKSGSGGDVENKSPVDGSSHGSTHKNKTGTTVGSSSSSTATKGTSAWGSRGGGTGTARGDGGQSPIGSSSSTSNSNSASSHYNSGNSNEYSGNGSHTHSNGGGSGASSSTSSSSSGFKSAWDRSSISSGAQKGVDKPTPTKTSTTTASVGANSTTNSESRSSSSGGGKGSTDSKGDSGMSSHSSSSTVDNEVDGDSARSPSSSSSSSSDNKDSGEEAIDTFPWGDDVSGTSEDSHMQELPASSPTHASSAGTGSINSTTAGPALTHYADSTPAPVQGPKADAASLSQTSTNAGVVTTTTTTSVTTTTGPVGAVATNSGSSRQNGGGGDTERGTWVILNGQKVWVAENSAVAIDGPWSMSDPSGRVSSDDMAHLRLRSTQKRTSTPPKVDPEAAYNGFANMAAPALTMAQIAAKQDGGQAAGAVAPAVAQAATGVIDSTNKAMTSSIEGVSSATNNAVSSMASNTQNVIHGATNSVNGAASNVNTAVHGLNPTSTDSVSNPPSITSVGGLSSAENEMAACLGSLGSQTQTDQIFETWDQGVSQTPAGQVASQTLQHAIDSLNLNPADASKLKASYALYDTWLKTGSPSRGRRRQQRKLQLGMGDPSLVNTYSALTPSLTTPCKAAYKSMSTDEAGVRSSGSSSGFSNSGEMHCNTYAKPTMSLQLCQSSLASPSSSSIQVKGSVTNTGTAAVCLFTLIVENFDKAISFYPTWLPKYRGTFMPGDVATFGVTLPGGLLSTQVSIGEDVSTCEAVGTNVGAPVQVSPSQSQGPLQSSSTLSQQAWATSASSVFVTDGGAPKVKSNFAAGRGPMTSLSGIDWGAVGGADTSCLATCMFIINDMTHCEAYDAIGAFRCDTCSTETYARIQETCRGQGCSASKCHVSEAKGPTNGGQSVKNNVSLILGVLTVFLMMQLT